MACRTIVFDGRPMIVCSRVRARPTKTCSCGQPSEFLCDWKIGKHANGRAKRCSRAVCRDHALEIAADKHLCGEHQEAYQRWLRRASTP